MNFEDHHRFHPLDDNHQPTALTDEIKLHVIYAILEQPPVTGSHIDRPEYYIDRFAYAASITDDTYLNRLARPDFRRHAFWYVCNEIEQKAKECLQGAMKLEVYDHARGPEMTSSDAAAIIHGWSPDPLIAEFARVYSPLDDRAEDIYRTTELLGSAIQADKLSTKQPLADWTRIAHAHGVRITQELQHATGVTDGVPDGVLKGRSRQERQFRGVEKKLAYYKERLDAANAKLARLSVRNQDLADATAVVLFDELTRVSGKALSLRAVQRLLQERHIEPSHNTWRNQLERGRAYIELKQK